MPGPAFPEESRACRIDVPGSGDTTDIVFPKSIEEPGQVGYERVRRLRSDAHPDRGSGLLRIRHRAQPLHGRRREKALRASGFTLRTLPPTPDEPLDNRPGGAGGLPLHAGVATGGNERAKLERPCRYISRPALSEKRLPLTSDGRVCRRFETPWRDGTTDTVLDPSTPSPLSQSE